MRDAPGALELLLVLAYVASFAIGLGPVVWVLIAEIFPTRIRGRAMSLATISLWSACTLVSMTFLTLVEALTAAGAFWLYAVLSAATFAFVWRAVPETKGKTLEELEVLWTRDGRPGDSAARPLTDRRPSS
ncbi:MAG: MFS transporter [Planctomycetes bacterium]|nr:MFS transporter [Planctomycetota bacterium]